MADPLANRIARWAVLNGDCLEWSGYVNKGGYGKIFVNGKAEFAHRAAWSVHKGDIPDGMKVLHKCDNRKCVNVSHLFLGTQKDNMADMAAKKRRRGVGGQRGSVHWKSKLTEEAVLEIRSSNAAEDELAAKYGTTKKHIWHVRNRYIWKHI